MTNASTPLTVRYGVGVSPYGGFTRFRILRETARNYFGNSDGWGKEKWSKREGRIDKTKIHALFNSEEEMDAALKHAKDADERLQAAESSARRALSEAVKTRRETLYAVLRGEQS